jgi:hypothetical protein
MKLKSILPLCAALAGLMIPTLSKADAPASSSVTYGYFTSQSVDGFIDVSEVNGKIAPTYLNLMSTSATSYWYAQVYSVSVLSNTVDAQSNKHSVIKALLMFTGGKYNGEPAIAEVDLTVAPNGTQTFGTLITDYYTGKPLFSTGNLATSNVATSNVATSAGTSMAQQPVTSGHLQIVP